MDGYMQIVYLALESPWKEELLYRKWLEFAYAIGRFLSSPAWGITWLIEFCTLELCSDGAKPLL